MCYSVTGGINAIKNSLKLLTNFVNRVGSKQKVIGTVVGGLRVSQGGIWNFEASRYFICTSSQLFFFPIYRNSLLTSDFKNKECLDPLKTTWHSIYTKNKMKETTKPFQCYQNCEVTLFLDIRKRTLLMAMDSKWMLKMLICICFSLNFKCHCCLDR